jgi:hypothetical protein
MEPIEKLKTYTSAMTDEQRTEFATKCQTTWPFLRNVMYGYRKPGEKLCVRLEAGSDGFLDRASLRPYDYWEIWPDLAAPKEQAHV